MSGSLYVWCQLYFIGQDGPYKDGDAFKIKPEENDSDVADLKGRAYAKRDADLKHCNADDLLVYRPGTEFNTENEPEALGVGISVTALHNELQNTTPPTDDEHPLIVVAPAPPQQRRNIRPRVENEPIDNASAKRQRISPGQEKVKLDCGDGAKKFGGPQDRELAKEDMIQGLECLAAKRGKNNLDQTEVPVLWISAPRKSGKTEFLRWVFNECCSFNPGAGETAKEVLRRINCASPEGSPKLDRLLVLYASFNEESTSKTLEESDIHHITIEKLRLSFEGRVDMRGFNAAVPNKFRCWSELYQMFSKECQNIGFVVCIDDISKLRESSESKYRNLMSSLLGFSQSKIREGDYFAFVGTSLHIHDFGKVLEGSGRAMRQIRFPSNQPTMETKTREAVMKSQIFASAATEEQRFFLEVAVQVARSSPLMSHWLTVANSQTKVSIPHISYELPDGIDADEVFCLAARTVLGQQFKESAKRRKKIEAVLDELHGSAEVHCWEYDGLQIEWDNAFVTLSLPLWRLLQFKFPQDNQLFSYVQNWVFQELHQLFYYDGPSEAVQTWELAIMGLLELRKAMLLSVRRRTPSLCGIIGEIGAFLKVSDDIRDTPATEKTASNSFHALPSGSDPCMLPCFHYTKKPNRQGVEGVFRGGFKDLAIFFQMSLYDTADRMDIRVLLSNAHDKARKLGYKEGTYIVQLFVTGTTNIDVAEHYDDWPQNSVVFADDAIQHLFKPFGERLFPEMVKRRRRAIW